MERIRGHICTDEQYDKYLETAKKIAELLAESKAKYTDVEIIFEMAREFITVA